MGETARDIRLIAFDLDGTLLTEEKRLTARTRDILEEASARGILLLTTTGRALRGIPDAVKTLSGAKYALTANGAGVYRRIDARIDAREPDRQDDPSTRASGTTARTVWTEPLPHPAQEGYPTFELDTDHTYELLFERLMNRERTLALMAELATLEVMPDPFINGACYILADKIHLIDRMAVSDAMKEYIHASRTPVEDMQTFLSDKDIQKITINFASNAQGHRIDLEPVHEILKKYPDFVAVTGGIRNIEVSDRLATKGDAMMALAELLGITADQIVAFGDSENDITMLEAAGTGVAMANALDITKDAADAITLSNEEDGVAVYLENLL